MAETTKALARSQEQRPATTGHGGNLTGAQRHIFRINDMEEEVTTTVWLSPDPVDGHVYKSVAMFGEGRCALTAVALRMLGTARGLRQVVDKCGFRTLHFKDGPQDVYEAVIVIRNLEGVEEEVSGMVPVIDLTPGSDDYEELKEQCRGYRQKGSGKFVEFSPEEAAVKLRKALNQAKKNRPQMSITKAINYCIRKALHIQPSYTEEQIRNLPFMVRSRQFSPNLANPEIRAAVTRQGAAAAASLYGPQAEQKALPAPAPESPVETAEWQVVEEQDPPFNPITGEVFEDAASAIDPEEGLVDGYVRDIREADSLEQLTAIATVIQGLEDITGDERKLLQGEWRQRKAELSQ